VELSNSVRCPSNNIITLIIRRHKMDFLHFSEFGHIRVWRTRMEGGRGWSESRSRYSRAKIQPCNGVAPFALHSCFLSTISAKVLLSCVNYI
jgi:hypothetical protein